MLSTRSPEDLRAILLQLAAQSASVKEERAHVINLFKAALALLEDVDSAPPEPELTPTQRKGLVELARMLGLAAADAEGVASEDAAGRRRLRSVLREALGAIDGTQPAATLVVDEAVENALRSLFEMLDVAREHAEFLMRRAGALTAAPPPA